MIKSASESLAACSSIRSISTCSPSPGLRQTSHPTLPYLLLSAPGPTNEPDPNPPVPLSFQGYKMDDLLTSYISLMLSSLNKQKMTLTRTK